MANKEILITGGAGFIGSHVNKMLNRKGYQTIVLDNLSKGHQGAVLYGSLIVGDLADTHLLKHIFEKHSIQAVMHFAAFTDVGESVANPAKYYSNNVASTLNLLNTMLEHRVRTIIFSSSAAIYGYPHKPLLQEDHPCAPISPYGESKWMVEKILQNYSEAYGIKYGSLRYFNAAGGDPEGEIKNYRAEASNLIPRILLKLKKGENEAVIYGTDYSTSDGTCLRDYIHLNDLGDAHIALLENLLSGSLSASYNLGNGKGFSVREVIASIEKVVGKKIQILESSRRPGDPPILVADSNKAAEQLHWRPKYGLDEMIAHAWTAMQFNFH